MNNSQLLNQKLVQLFIKVRFRYVQALSSCYPCGSCVTASGEFPGKLVSGVEDEKLCERRVKVVVTCG